jgi:hypothetical protein
LQTFDELVKKRNLRALQFIAREQLDEFWSLRLFGSGSAWAMIGNIAERLGRQTDQECEASPVPEVRNLSPNWKRCLRDAMQILDDWRNPQIVVPESRRSDWPTGHEVRIQFEECGTELSSGPYERLLVGLETYDLHPNASADFDPWDLTQLHPSSNPDLVHLAHPCRLPRSPSLESVPLEHLVTKLSQLKQNEGSKLYYIPPRDWRPSATKAQWRACRAFPFREQDGHWGFMDIQGFIWEWHDAERHWDVQMKPYRRISKAD